MGYRKWNVMLLRFWAMYFRVDIVRQERDRKIMMVQAECLLLRCRYFYLREIDGIQYGVFSTESIVLCLPYV